MRCASANTRPGPCGPSTIMDAATRAARGPCRAAASHSTPRLAETHESANRLLGTGAGLGLERRYPLSERGCRAPGSCLHRKQQTHSPRGGAARQGVVCTANNGCARPLRSRERRGAKRRQVTRPAPLGRQSSRLRPALLTRRYGSPHAALDRDAQPIHPPIQGLAAEAELRRRSRDDTGGPGERALDHCALGLGQRI